MAHRHTLNFTGAFSVLPAPRTDFDSCCMCSWYEWHVWATVALGRKDLRWNFVQS